MSLATAKPRSSMTADEAREITEAIRGNFDSLGKMLIEVQERKGFKALGYSTFESYCKTEFGKSKSRVYQLIEETKIEEEIIEALGEGTPQPPKTLRLPGSQLRVLKRLDSPQERIEAISFADSLAQSEGKNRRTKTHLQVAVLSISGKKTEEMRDAMRTLGFSEKTEVEIVQGRNKGQRGIIRRIDKQGQIYVAMHLAGATPIPYEVRDLKIVPPEDRPRFPASWEETNLGDTVYIYSTNWKGQSGTVVSRLNEKQALIQIEGIAEPATLPYAELELVEQGAEPASWDKSLVWSAYNCNWHFDAEKQEISVDRWPHLKLYPRPAKTESPSEWLDNWVNSQGSNLAYCLLSYNPSKVQSLVLATAIKMSEAEKQAFLQSLVGFFKDPDQDLAAELEEVKRDRDRLRGELELLKDKGSHPLHLYLDPVDELQEQKGGEDDRSTGSGAGSGDTDQISFDISDDRELSNARADSGGSGSHDTTEETPSDDSDRILEREGDSASEGEISVPDESAELKKLHQRLSEPYLADDLHQRLSQQREKLLTRKQELARSLNQSKKRTVRQKLSTELASVSAKLQDLSNFVLFKLGMIVQKQDKQGEITFLDLSPGGMPQVWVKWDEESPPEPEMVSLLSIPQEQEL